MFLNESKRNLIINLKKKKQSKSNFSCYIEVKNDLIVLQMTFKVLNENPLDFQDHTILK